MRFQRLNWRIERFGWLLMALIVAVAALGAFGGGPLSSATVSDAGGTVRVEYDRIQRQRSPASLRLDVSAGAVGAHGLVVVVDETFARIFEIKDIQPTPAGSAAVTGGIRLRFDVEPGAAATIHFRLGAEQIGVARPRLSVAGRSPLELPVLIYP